MKHVDEGSADRKRKRLRLDKTFSLTFSLKRDAKITVDDKLYLKKQLYYIVCSRQFVRNQEIDVITNSFIWVRERVQKRL